MHRIALLVPLLILVACDDGKASTESPDGDTKAEAKPAAEAWSKVAAGASLAGKIKARVADAEKAKLKPVVYVGATWCEPCLAIKKHRDDPRMKEAFTGVAIIEVDMDQWKSEQFAELNMKPSAIPVFYAVGSDGKATGKEIDGGAWGDNIPENMAPPLKRFFSSI